LKVVITKITGIYFHKAPTVVHTPFFFWSIIKQLDEEKEDIVRNQILYGPVATIGMTIRALHVSQHKIPCITIIHKWLIINHFLGACAEKTVVKQLEK
jgi:hypothetical protein